MKPKSHIIHLALIAITLLGMFGSCLEDEARDRISEDQAITSPTSLWINSIGTLYNSIGSAEDGTTRNIPRHIRL